MGNGEIQINDIWFNILSLKIKIRFLIKKKTSKQMFYNSTHPTLHTHSDVVLAHTLNRYDRMFRVAHSVPIKYKC